MPMRHDNLARRQVRKIVGTICALSRGFARADSQKVNPNFHKIGVWSSTTNPAAVGEYSKRSLSPSTRRVIIGAPSRFSPTAVSEGIARTPALAATSTSSPQATTGWSGSTPSSLGSRAAICWPVAHASPSLSSFGTPIAPPLCDVPVGRSETFHRRRPTRQDAARMSTREESRKCFRRCCVAAGFAM